MIIVMPIKAERITLIKSIITMIVVMNAMQTKVKIMLESFMKIQAIKTITIVKIMIMIMIVLMIQTVLFMKIIKMGEKSITTIALMIKTLMKIKVLKIKTAMK